MHADITKNELKERADRLKKEIERVNMIYDKSDAIHFISDIESKTMGCKEKDHILKEIDYILKFIDSEIAYKRKIEEEMQSLMMNRNISHNDIIEAAGNETYNFIRRAATEINRRLWQLGDLYSPTNSEMKRVNIILGKKYEFNAARKIGHGIKATDKNVKSANCRKKLIDLIKKYKEECKPVVSKYQGDGTLWKKKEKSK